MSGRRYGRAFGVERAGDNLGAVAGPLLAACLVSWWGIRPAIWWSVVPGLLAAVAITAAGTTARPRPGHAPAHPVPAVPTAAGQSRLRLRGLRGPGLAGVLWPVALFECGNLATTLIILRATDVLGHAGISGAAGLAMILYAAHNALAAAASALGGLWLDRTGARFVFAVAITMFAAAYALLATRVPGAVVAGFLLAGGGIGLAETAESTLIARVLPDGRRGSGFGALGGVEAGGSAIAAVTAGALYAGVGGAAAFLYGAALMVPALAGVGMIRLREGAR